MASSGPNSGSSAATIDDSGFPWSNPNNALVADGSYTTCSPSSGESTDWLQVSNFGFSIPVGATINGIVVEVKILATITNSFDSVVVQLVTAAADEGGPDSDPNSIPTVASYVTVGSPTSLWQGSWTSAKINDSTFSAKVKIFADTGPPAIVKIDHVRVTVYYTPAVGGGASIRRGGLASSIASLKPMNPSGVTIF